MRATAWVPVLLLAGAAGTAAAADWPEFRGPTGQGIVPAGEKLPLQWGPDTNVKWKAELPGTAWSSPVIVGGKVFLTNAAPKNDQGDLLLQALCLDAGTGKELWKETLFEQDARKAPKIHSKNSHASPTPIVHGDKVYVHFGHMGTACLGLDGKVVWKNADLAYSPVHGNGGSPAVVNDLLVFSVDSSSDRYVVALKLADGTVKWKTPRAGNPDRHFSFSTPLVIEVNGKKQIVSPGSGIVGAYDPDTGKEIWRVRYGEGYSVIPRPVFADGLVFVCSGYNTPNLYAIRPDGEGDVTEKNVAWTVKRNVPHTPSLIANGGYLFMVSDGGIASCLETKTGKEVWSERLGGGFSASPILADGKLYFTNEKGQGFVVKAGPKFEVLQKNDLKEPTLASFAAADGALFVRTRSLLYRFQGE